jgi:hypothetical protein
VLRAPRYGGIEKNLSSAEIEDSVGDRQTGGCAASREKRITCVAFGIRNHPRERIADRHGAYRPALPGFVSRQGARRFLPFIVYQLPLSKVLLQNLPWSTPFQRKGVVRLAAGVPYRRSSS